MGTETIRTFHSTAFRDLREELVRGEVRHEHELEDHAAVAAASPLPPMR